MDLLDEPATFPIRELARLTGVGTSTLRAWETRHGLLKPTRTASGHRLYSAADVERVQRLQDYLGQGLSLAEIVPLLDLPPAQAQASDPTTDTGGPAAALNPAWQGYLRDTLRAVEDFSTERLDALYSEACAVYPIDLLTPNLLIPVLEHLGLRWDRRPSGIAEEHFFSAWLRSKLGARLHHSQGLVHGKPVVLACLAGEHHEIGLLLCALGLIQAGRRVIYLGADMPVRQIVHVSRQTHAEGIVLAGRGDAGEAELLADLAWLAEAAAIPVFVGSHVSVRLRQALRERGAIPLGDNLGLGPRLIESHLARAPQTGSRGGRTRP